MTIVSLYAPDFMPDMVKTGSYGGYQDTLAGHYEIRFDKGAKLPDSSVLPKYMKLQNVKQSTEPITHRKAEHSLNPHRHPGPITTSAMSQPEENTSAPVDIGQVDWSKIKGIREKVC